MDLVRAQFALHVTRFTQRSGFFFALAGPCRHANAADGCVRAVRIGFDKCRKVCFATKGCTKACKNHSGRPRPTPPELQRLFTDLPDDLLGRIQQADRAEITLYQLLGVTDGEHWSVVQPWSEKLHQRVLDCRRATLSARLDDEQGLANLLHFVAAVRDVFKREATAILYAAVVRARWQLGGILPALPRPVSTESLTVMLVQLFVAAHQWERIGDTFWRRHEHLIQPMAADLVVREILEVSALTNNNTNRKLVRAALDALPCPAALLERRCVLFANGMFDLVDMKFFPVGEIPHDAYALVQAPQQFDRELLASAQALLRELCGTFAPDRVDEVVSRVKQCFDNVRPTDAHHLEQQHWQPATLFWFWYHRARMMDGAGDPKASMLLLSGAAQAGKGSQLSLIRCTTPAELQFQPPTISGSEADLAELQGKLLFVLPDAAGRPGIQRTTMNKILDREQITLPSGGPRGSTVTTTVTSDVVGATNLPVVFRDVRNKSSVDSVCDRTTLFQFESVPQEQRFNDLGERLLCELAAVVVVGSTIRRLVKHWRDNGLMNGHVESEEMTAWRRDLAEKVLKTISKM